MKKKGDRVFIATRKGNLLGTIIKVKNNLLKVKLDNKEILKKRFWWVKDSIYVVKLYPEQKGYAKKENKYDRIIKGMQRRDKIAMDYFKKKEEDKITKVITSCIFCLSNEHQSSECPNKKERREK